MMLAMQVGAKLITVDVYANTEAAGLSSDILITDIIY